MVTELYSAGDFRPTDDPANTDNANDRTDKESQQLGGSTDSRSSTSRLRKHLATYQILSRPYHLINHYTPYNLPSRVLNNAPAIPGPIDTAADTGLVYVDKVVESRVQSFKRTYDRWVTRPQENILTGVQVYSQWGKGHVAGGLRRLEEGIFSVGEYLLPVEADDDHDHAGMHSYWTSTESVLDSDDEADEQKKKEEEVEEQDGSSEGKPTYAAVAAAGVVSKDGKLMPLTPVAHAHGKSHPPRRRSASTPSLPPFEPGKPEKELEGIRNLLYVYARRTYIRNAHKSPSQILLDALDLARTEAKKATLEFDKRYSIEIGYWHKMMDAGR